MMRALFAGVSGLQNHQTAMDVIGDNIANVNTVGYKASRTTFQDMLSQTMQAAASPQSNIGGTNPIQIGLGVGLASVDTVFTDGSTESTGVSTDLAISGQGFFVLSNGTDKYYTRNGGFTFDQQGNFVVPGTGYKVDGWMADSSGNINTNNPISAISIPVGLPMSAKATTSLDFGSSTLNASDASGNLVAEPMKEVYDSRGNKFDLTQNFYKVNQNTYLVSASVTNPATGGTNPNIVSGQTKEITFDSNGNVSTVKDANFGAGFLTFSAGVAPTPDNSAVGAVTSMKFNAYDQGLGLHSIELRLTNTSTAGTGTYTYQMYDNGNAVGTAATGQTGFPASGSIPGTGITFTTGAAATSGNSSYPQNLTGGYSTTSGTPSALVIDPSTATGASIMNITNTFTNMKLSNVTSFNSSQNGYASGTLKSTAIDGSGIIHGTFSNGQTLSLGQVALANFNNPGGLNKVGDTMYQKSNNSGDATIGAASSGGYGTLAGGKLEMSNVDLSQEFSNMIIIQRGFQANSKIITTADDMLNTLAELKR